MSSSVPSNNDTSTSLSQPNFDIGIQILKNRREKIINAGKYSERYQNYFPRHFDETKFPLTSKCRETMDLYRRVSKGEKQITPIPDKKLTTPTGEKKTLTTEKMKLVTSKSNATNDLNKRENALTGYKAIPEGSTRSVVATAAASSPTKSSKWFKRDVNIYNVTPESATLKAKHVGPDSGSNSQVFNAPEFSSKTSELSFPETSTKNKYQSSTDSDSTKSAPETKKINDDNTTTSHLLEVEDIITKLNEKEKKEENLRKFEEILRKFSKDTKKPSKIAEKPPLEQIKHCNEIENLRSEGLSEIEITHDKHGNTKNQGDELKDQDEAFQRGAKERMSLNDNHYINQPDRREAVIKTKNLSRASSDVQDKTELKPTPKVANRNRNRKNVDSTSGNGPPATRSRQKPADTPISIGKYKLLKTIGKGNFAKVKLAKHVPTGKEVAIKIIDKTQLNAGSLQKLSREVKIMKMLDHPNIVKLYQVIETDNTLYLVMEYASGGEVFDYLVLNGKLKEKEARAKFRQIVSAVQYCHQKRIIHRDLKAENLLLDKEMNIKIADFGFSNEFTPGNKLDTFCGSPPYAAPELFQGKKYDGPEVDVWSLGVILYTLVSGGLPFDGLTLRELRERVLRGKYRIPFYMSTDCENLLKKILVLNPAKRATLECVMKDKWLNHGYEEELKPYVEPVENMKDRERIEALIKFGYSRNMVENSLEQRKFDDIYATYMLLAKRKYVDIERNGSVSLKSIIGHSKSPAPQPPTAQGSINKGVQRSNSAAQAKPDRSPVNGTQSQVRSLEPNYKSNVASKTAENGIMVRGRHSTITNNNKFQNSEKPKVVNETVGSKYSPNKLRSDSETGQDNVVLRSSKIPASAPFARTTITRNTFHSGQTRPVIGRPKEHNDTAPQARSSFLARLGFKGLTKRN